MNDKPKPFRALGGTVLVQPLTDEEREEYELREYEKMFKRRSADD